MQAARATLGHQDNPDSILEQIAALTAALQEVGKAMYDQQASAVGAPPEHDDDDDVLDVVWEEGECSA